MRSFHYSHSTGEETKAYRDHMVPESEVESMYFNFGAYALDQCAIFSFKECASKMSEISFK